MMVPNEDTIWQYIGPGHARGDIQRVVFSDMVETVTISERDFPWLIEWSWLGKTEDFPKVFRFIKVGQ